MRVLYHISLETRKGPYTFMREYWRRHYTFMREYSARNYTFMREIGRAGRVRQVGQRTASGRQQGAWRVQRPQRKIFAFSVFFAANKNCRGDGRNQTPRLRIGNTIAQGLMDYASDRGISNEFIDSLQLSESGNMISGRDVSNIVSSAVTARNTAECLGMTSAISFLNQHKFCVLHKYLTISQASDDIGRPAGAPLALTSFTAAGFVLCSNAHPQVSRATLYEKRMLTNMMNSGFYVSGS